MDTNKIDEIKKRLADATPGKWSFVEADGDTYFDCHTDANVKDKWGDNYSIIAALGQSSDSYWIRNAGDKDLIENAVNDIQFLLQELAVRDEALELAVEYIDTYEGSFVSSEGFIEKARKVVDGNPCSPKEAVLNVLSSKCYCAAIPQAHTREECEPVEEKS